MKKVRDEPTELRLRTLEAVEEFEQTFYMVHVWNVRVYGTCCCSRKLELINPQRYRVSAVMFEWMLNNVTSIPSRQAAIRNFTRNTRVDFYAFNALNDTFDIFSKFVFSREDHAEVY